MQKEDEVAFDGKGTRSIERSRFSWNRLREDKLIPFWRAIKMDNPPGFMGI